MTWEASISHHLDLFTYWNAKRGSRPMPDRRDLDPTEIKALLPNIGIVERDRGGYRWRLMGTAIATDMGRDLTGQRLGEYVGDIEFIKRVIATYERALAHGRPIFEEGVYESAFHVLHSVSRLVLPLAVAGEPAMVIFTRISREHRNSRAERDWLKGALGMVRGTFEIDSREELERRVTAWEQGATSSQ